MYKVIKVIFLLLCSSFASNLYAACHDSVVLVHGNTESPASWDNTYNLLIANGYTAGEIFRPDWGSKTCASCNDHSGSEETPVRNAINNALASSCTGKIDVIGHSMGATLAAQQIIKTANAGQVDTFVGVAGAFRGLWLCGVYPFNVWSSTCGYYGLSVNSPFLNSIYAEPLATKTYSIKSFYDQIVCATGTCYVGLKHSSRIEGETASLTFNSYDHFELQTHTAQTQYNLIQ